MPEAIQQQQQAADPYANLSEHDRKMLEVAQKNGVRVVVSDSQSGSRTDYTMTAAIESNATQEPAPSASKVERPAHIPEKFWNAEKGEVNVEAMAKSYAELEASRSKPSIAQPGTPAAPAAAPAVKPAAAPQIDMGKAVDAVLAAQAELHAATDDAAKAAAQTKLDAANTAAKAVADAAAAETAKTANVTQARAEATAELQRDGKISDATYAKLEQAGFDRETVDNYVAGEKARAEVVELKVYNEAGSKEEYAKMVQWAAANWSPEQVTAFNAALEKNDLTATLGAVKSLKSAYTEASGTDATVRVSGGGNNVVTGDMFRSKQEVNAAMSDKRYTSGDKAFHAEVDRKLEAAIKANIDLGF